MDAASVLKRIHAETDWRQALAYAIGYLSRIWWTRLPIALRDHQLSESAANRLVKDFHDPRELAKDLLVWLQDRPLQNESLLDFVLAFDQGLERMEDSDTTDLIDFRTSIGEAQTIQMWRARRGLLRTLDPTASPEMKLKLNQDFTPGLDERLMNIRFLNQVHDMPPAAVRTLQSDVAARLHDLFYEGRLTQPLRIGMFSLRGDFAPPIEYRGAEQDWHRFHLGEFVPDQQQAYAQAIRAVVRAASDPARGTHILVLPEFMITPKGRTILKDALLEVSRIEPLIPPILTIAGTCHAVIPETSDVGNACEIYDSRGEVLWTQWKRVPFTTEWSAQTAKDRIRDFPPDLDPTSRVKLREAIEWHGPTVIIRTPIGSMGVAICSDMVTNSEGSPGVYVAELPIDCLIVPAFSDRTQPFVDRALLLSRSMRVVFFVNAWPAVEFGSGKTKIAAPTEIHPPAQAPADPERILASFLSTPWTGRPIEFWRDENNRYEVNSDLRFWLAFDEVADGLIVDLRKLILKADEPILDQHLTH